MKKFILSSLCFANLIASVLISKPSYIHFSEKKLLFFASASIFPLPHPTSAMEFISLKLILDFFKILMFFQQDVVRSVFVIFDVQRHSRTLIILHYMTFVTVRNANRPAKTMLAVGSERRELLRTQPRMDVEGPTIP